MYFYIHILASHSTPTPNPRTLQAGDKMPHPSHIPDHMPAFPDPHTYIRTLVRTLLYQNYLETIKNAFEREATLVNVQFSEQFIWVKWIEVVIINNRITYMYIQEIFKWKHKIKTCTSAFLSKFQSFFFTFEMHMHVQWKWHVSLKAFFFKIYLSTITNERIFIWNIHYHINVQIILCFWFNCLNFRPKKLQ